MPSTIYLITGGCRSGKSNHAQRLCETLTQNPIYLATSQTQGQYTDSDMNARIKRHQNDRGDDWTTIEEPMYPSHHLAEMEGRVVLVDCLTLWLTNFMLDCHAFSLTGEEISNQDMRAAAERALSSLKKEFNNLISQWSTTFVFVSNELGSGSHSSQAFTRCFVDYQGWLNQFVASKADTVIHMIAGCARVIKKAGKDDRGHSCSMTETEKEEALMLDKFLSSRQITMDSKGYFMLKLVDKRIVASFYSCIVNDEGEVCDLEGNKIKCCDGKVRDPLKVFKARTAKELTTSIFEQWDDISKLELSLGHAAYIGREALRAEHCLYSNQKYQQD